MAEIIVIAAVAENNVIGNKGDIPWRISEDFQRFKKITLGYPCVMGDRTYESLPVRPLPERENIVLSLDPEYKAEGTTVFHDWNEALAALKDREKVFICGGASIYRLGMKVASTLELTRVNQTPEGDTFFPEINLEEWNLVNEEKHEGFSFQTYKRKEAVKDE